MSNIETKAKGNCGENGRPTGRNYNAHWTIIIDGCWRNPNGTYFNCKVPADKCNGSLPKNLT